MFQRCVEEIQLLSDEMKRLMEYNISTHSNLISMAYSTLGEGISSAVHTRGFILEVEIRRLYKLFSTVIDLEDNCPSQFHDQLNMAINVELEDKDSSDAGEDGDANEIDDFDYFDEL